MTKGVIEALLRLSMRNGLTRSKLAQEEFLLDQMTPGLALPQKVDATFKIIKHAVLNVPGSTSGAYLRAGFNISEDIDDYGLHDSDSKSRESRLRDAWDRLQELGMERRDDGTIFGSFRNDLLPELAFLLLGAKRGEIHVSDAPDPTPISTETSSDCVVTVPLPHPSISIRECKVEFSGHFMSWYMAMARSQVDTGSMPATCLRLLGSDQSIMAFEKRILRQYRLSSVDSVREVCRLAVQYVELYETHFSQPRSIEALISSVICEAWRRPTDSSHQCLEARYQDFDDDNDAYFELMVPKSECHVDREPFLEDPFSPTTERNRITRFRNDWRCPDYLVQLPETTVIVKGVPGMISTWLEGTPRGAIWDEERFFDPGNWNLSPRG